MNKIDINWISLLGIGFFLAFSFSHINCNVFQDSRTSQRLEDEKRERIIKTARQLEGSRYRYGGKTPRGFDCSGFAIYVFNKEGIKLSASSKRQSKQGKYKEIKDAEPGDLVFFGPTFKIDHVGIVTQNKKGKLHVIHSTNSQGVVEHDVFQILYWKKRLKFARDVISP